MDSGKVCGVDDCIKPARAKGYCLPHYKRLVRHGSPTGGRPKHAPNGVPTKWIFDHLNHEDSVNCLKWPFASRGEWGYGAVSDEDGKLTGAHQMMCRLKNGPRIDKSYYALHSCGKGHEACVNPHHLYWGTQKQNAADRVLHGTEPFGELSKNAKVTEDQVKEMVALRGIETQKSLALRFGISQAHVSVIQLGRVWTHLGHERNDNRRKRSKKSS